MRPFYGFAGMTASGPRWTGRVELIPSKLAEPLHWRKPCRVFVNSMSDLFHESLPDEAIEQVFAVMRQARRHTFQVLTKRPRRMVEYLRRHAEPESWIWLGVSVEDQATADERIPRLLQAPAALRFVSYEPALGPVDFAPWFSCGPTGHLGPCALHRPHWLIVGGESGPGARPCDMAWIRSAVRQCREAGVACFVKQVGANITGPHRNGVNLTTWRLSHRKGGDPSEWPEDLRVREYPEPAGVPA